MIFLNTFMHLFCHQFSGRSIGIQSNCWPKTNKWNICNSIVCCWPECPLRLAAGLCRNAFPKKYFPTSIVSLWYASSSPALHCLQVVGNLMFCGFNKQCIVRPWQWRHIEEWARGYWWGGGLGEQCSLDTRGGAMSNRNPSYRGSNVVYIRLKPSLVITILWYKKLAELNLFLTFSQPFPNLTDTYFHWFGWLDKCKIHGMQSTRWPLDLLLLLAIRAHG